MEAEPKYGGGAVKYFLNNRFEFKNPNPPRWFYTEGLILEYIFRKTDSENDITQKSDRQSSMDTHF